jgi:hypothetical protein
MTTDQIPPLENYDEVFQLPDGIFGYHDLGERLQVVYDLMIQEHRRDMRLYDLTSTQIMLIERIAFYYCLIKYKEASDSWVGQNERKDLNSHLIALIKEYTAQTAVTRDEYRTAVMDHVKEVIIAVTQDIEDPKVRMQVASRMAEAVNI